MYGRDGTGYNIHTGQYRSRFDGLNAIVDSYDFSYNDLGQVDSVHETGKALYRKFDGEAGARRFEEGGGGRHAVGMMCANTAYVGNGAFTQAYGFREPQRTKYLDDFVGIHEQVHGLHAARNITDAKTNKQYRHGIMLLEDQMRSDGYDTSAIAQYRDFHKLRDDESGTAAKEFVANFGAFYRMEKLGYSEEQMKNHAYTHRAPQMIEAYEAFMKAKGKPAAQESSLEDRLASFRPVFRPIFNIPAVPQRHMTHPVAKTIIDNEDEQEIYGLLRGFFRKLYRWYMRNYGSRQYSTAATYAR